MGIEVGVGDGTGVSGLCDVTTIKDNNSDRAARRKSALAGYLIVQRTQLRVNVKLTGVVAVTAPRRSCHRLILIAIPSASIATRTEFSALRLSRSSRWKTKR